MENDASKKSNIANSILAKFQQFSKEKEAAKEKILETTYSQENRKKRKAHDEILHTGISEKDVGITEYISSNLEGFAGILKHRFTDFQVHEIDLDHKIVELTSTEAIGIPVETVDIDRGIIPNEYWDQIDGLLKGEDKTIEIDVSDKDKSERSLIHKTIKAIYGTKVFSNTKNNAEGKTAIFVGKATNKERVCWPESLPQFLHFTVTKKNMDTTHFIYLFSKKLRCKPNAFTYAGMKDRRAITSQRMCIKRRKAEDLAKHTMWGVKIGNYEYKHKHLRLGDLFGNKFTITIRNVKADDDVINKAMESLKTNGFINYFGLQRFGSSAVAPTFQIGKAILKKDWKLAVELILKPRPDEKAPIWVKSARESWWQTRESGQAMKHLSKHQNSIEFRVLQALKNTPTDYHGALLSIPRNTLMLYLHSYQSYIWNRIVSRRIQTFKLEPQVGDLILDIKEGLEDEISVESLESPGKSNEEDLDDEQEDEVDGEEPLGSTEEAKKKIAVKALTEEDVKTTSIYDILYPLPGYDVEFPKNEMSDWYQELLKEDNISVEDLKSNNRLFSLYGTYRKAFQTVEDLSWKIVRHDNFDDDLVLSDFDKLDNVTLPEFPAEGEHKSIVLDMTLKASTYATMALREALKTDTSVSFHATLTKNAQESAEKKVKLSEDENESIKTNGEET